MSYSFSPQRADYIHVRQTHRDGRTWYVIDAAFADGLSVFLAETVDFYTSLMIARKAAPSGMQIRLDLLPITSSRPGGKA